MSPRERETSAHDVGQRANHARAYLLVARVALDDSSMVGGTNVAGSNAVLSGISAADAMCGRALGVRSASESRADAVALLKRAIPPESRAATHLARLLGAKTDTQYSSSLLTAKKAGDLVTTAQKLVDEMESLLK